MVMVFVGVLSVKAMLLVVDCKYCLQRKSGQSNKPSLRKAFPVDASDAVMEDLLGDGLLAEDVEAPTPDEPRKPAAVSRRLV